MSKLSTEQQIRDLEIILESDMVEQFISKTYIIEKLQEIRRGSLNLHELVKQALIEECKDKRPTRHSK